MANIVPHLKHGETIYLFFLVQWWESENLLRLAPTSAKVSSSAVARALFKVGWKVNIALIRNDKLINHWIGMEPPESMWESCHTVGQKSSRGRGCCTTLRFLKRKTDWRVNQKRYGCHLSPSAAVFDKTSGWVLVGQSRNGSCLEKKETNVKM